MSESVFPKDHIFTRAEIIERFECVKHRTLGEIDLADVFHSARTNPKITGIAGSVIEQSVLGYAADCRKEHDILVDGVPTEVKTTGFRIVKGEHVAKEPMSITAVTPSEIIGEVFETSHFWDKLAHLLLIYYHYNSKSTVKAIDYAEFTIEGYEFHEFSEREVRMLKNDWEIVRDFIRYLKTEYSDDPEAQYPRISHELRSQLMLIDTAPKWPNPPRFRLKRSFVNEIIQDYFRREEAGLNVELSRYQDLDNICNRFTRQYKGLSVRQLMGLFGINQAKVDKAITERIIVRMFGGSATSMSNVELFRKIGLHGKTISLSCKGGRTEDMKLCNVDFEELQDKSICFEDSEIYEYFANNQLLCIIFQEKDENQNLEENRFIGFKRISFSEDFIQEEVRPVWEEVRSVILEKRLVKSYVYDKSGKQIFNKNGMPRTSVNFPKSVDHVIFLRGTGTDSSDTPLEINGIPLMRYQFWIRGRNIVDMLS